MSQILFHKTRRGVMAHFAADQCIGQSLKQYGEWAEEEIDLLRRYIQPGSTVLDVGANVGTHTIAFAKLVGPTGKVIAIEGQPEVASLLSYNILANQLVDTVQIVPSLAGKTFSLIPYKMVPSGDNVGARSFRQDVEHRDRSITPFRWYLNPIQKRISRAYREFFKLQEKGWKGSPFLTMRLPLIPIDSLNIRSCSLIKIDVEGMEYDVLKGARRLLRKFRPVLYFEYTPQNHVAFLKASKLLNSLGYSLYWHVSNPFNTNNMYGSRVNIFGGNVETNVLALPKEVSAPLAPALPPVSDPPLAPIRPSLEEGLPGVHLPLDVSSL